MKIKRHKYINPDRNISQLRCPGNASYCWKSIYKVADILKPGFMWHVGDGSDISLWYKWLHKGPLCDIVSSIPESTEN